jgi:capsular exopolysaccharide synthesis family protein
VLELKAVPTAGSNRPLKVKSPGPRSPFEAERDVHVFDWLGVLFRYRYIAATVFCLTTVGALLHTYSQTPMYRAQARIEIDDERTTAVPGVANQDANYYQDPEPYYQTQYRILQGRELARKVVTKLRLQEVPEFNGRGPEPTTVGRAKNSVQAFVTSLWSNQLPDAAVSRPPDEGALVGAFVSRIDIQPVRNSHLVDVAFQSASGDLAARAANTLAEEYVQQNLDFRVASVAQSVTWLTDELGKQQTKVEDSERALSEYREKQNAPSLDDRENIVVARLSQLNDGVTRAKMVRIQKEAVYEQLKEAQATGAGADTVAPIVESASIQALKNRLADLQREKTRLSEKYGDKHPDIQKVNAGIQEANQQLTVETAKVTELVKNEYEAALAEERVLSKSLEDQKASVLDLSKKSVGYTVLQREAQSNRQVYDSLLQRQKELLVVQNSRSNNVRLIDRAEVPGAPFTPNTRSIWPIAFGLGLVLSVVACFGLDYLNDTIKTPEDVQRKLGLTALGIVPSVRGTKKKTPILAAQVPNEFRESFNELRTSLVFSRQEPGPKVIAVTSSQPREGKTTSTANIGLALAAMGARVLMIDADMRRPTLHDVLGLQNEQGLSEILNGEVRASSVIRKSNRSNLFAITAGAIPPNPSELLASGRMKQLIRAFGASESFDWVIIDTPPVLAVTDAVIIAPMVSGVVMVIGAEMTRRRLARRALETLLSAKPTLLGVVLNRVDFTRNWFYYTRYYGRTYRSYYARAANA